MVDIQSATAEIRRGKKTKEERKKPLGKNIMACPIPQGGHNDDCMLSKSKIQVTQYIHSSMHNISHQQFSQLLLVMLSESKEISN